MLDHISIGVRDLAAATRFYRAVLAPLGYDCRFEGDGYAGFGVAQPEFWLNATEHPVLPDARSGLHICFQAPTAEAVQAFHAAALAQGGTDNGPPGPRPAYGPSYYAAFVIDPEGYRIEAHCAVAA